MEKDVIFEVTKDHLETGMRNIPVGYCATSFIDAKKGLFYVGRPLADLISWSPVKVIYLLLYGIEATDKELKNFEQDLISRSNLSPDFVKAVERLPQQADPLELLFCK